MGGKRTILDDKWYEMYIVQVGNVDGKAEIIYNAWLRKSFFHRPSFFPRGLFFAFAAE